MCSCAPAAHPRLRPFVGKSGKKMDVGIGGSRDGVFITNVRKCAPPSQPETDEEKAASIDHCVRAYLEPELAAIAEAQAARGRKRAAIQPIGADATRLLFGRGNMQKLHGSVFSRREWEAMAAAAESVPRFNDPEVETGVPDDDIPF